MINNILGFSSFGLSLAGLTLISINVGLTGWGFLILLIGSMAGVLLIIRIQGDNFPQMVFWIMVFFSLMGILRWGL